MFERSVKFNETAYKEYFVDIKGNIYSRSKVGKKVKKLIKQLNSRGYERVSIGGKHHLVHRIVAKIFIEKPHEECIVNHKDGNKTNNNVINLEWITPQENVNHSWSTGLSNSDFERKLTPEQVKEIRTLELRGTHTRKQIGDLYGISRQSINDIIHNKTYKNI